MNKRISIAALFLMIGALLFQSAAYAIAWKLDLVAALQEARKSGKPVMVDFYTPWCGWCKKLDSDVFGKPEIQKLAEKFICVKVDAEKNPTVAARYGVSGYPTVIFLNSSGTAIERIVGYEGAGSFGQKMSAILKTVEKRGGFVVTDEGTGRPSKGDKKIKAPSVGSDFVYNGYVEVKGEPLTAQINYGGVTYFVQSGDALKEYKVISVDKNKVVLDGKDGRLVMEFKKPVKE